jgi:hypothetical protein
MELPYRIEGRAWANSAEAPRSERRCESGPLARQDGSGERRGLLARIDAWFWRQRIRRHEAYLAESQNAYDLEQRMRRLEREEACPPYRMLG